MNDIEKKKRGLFSTIQTFQNLQPINNAIQQFEQNLQFLTEKNLFNVCNK